MEPATFYYFLFLLVLLLFIILLLPVTICIKVDNWRKNNFISLEMKLFFLLFYKTYNFKRYSSSVKKSTAKILSFGEIFKRQTLNKEFDFFLSGLAFFNHRLKTLNWRFMDLKLKAGTGDPAGTALLTGSLCGASSFLSMYLEKHYSFPKRPCFHIYPSFTDMCFYFELLFEFKTSVGRLLYMGLYLLAYLSAGRWYINAGTSGTSNSGLNENSHGKLKRNGGC